jgi:hypothetical protein
VRQANGVVEAVASPGHTTPAWIDAPTKALSYPFEKFVGGHLNRLSN